MPLPNARALPAGFVRPCLPTRAPEAPVGLGWLHEIKHDGYRLMARRAGERVRLVSRGGYDFTDRFPAIVDALARLGARSCLIDGEAVVCDDRGLAVFDLLRRSGRVDPGAILYGFDLLELDGEDLRRRPVEERKAALARLLRRAPSGLQLTEHVGGDGAIVFAHACRLGCEGIVSKRLGSSYTSGRCRDWFKLKNPAAPAATRELEEDWGR
jgi:bifunctional non-homologous end joining protein LigD